MLFLLAITDPLQANPTALMWAVMIALAVASALFMQRTMRFGGHPTFKDAVARFILLIFLVASVLLLWLEVGLLK